MARRPALLRNSQGRSGPTTRPQGGSTLQKRPTLPRLRLTTALLRRELGQKEWKRLRLTLPARGALEWTATKESSLVGLIRGPLCLREAHRAWRLRRYKSWIQRGLRHSKEGGITLIVDKAAHEMDLYLQGRRRHTYGVELGLNPQHRGRRTTPIGVFSLRYKSYTRYYKALLYKMPGYYEIHGSGTGRGRQGSDWTFGCVALSNGQMDDLYQRIGLEKGGILVEARQRKALMRRALLVIVPYGLRDHYCYEK